MNEKVRALYLFVLILIVSGTLMWNNLDTRIKKLEESDLTIRLPSIELRKQE